MKSETIVRAINKPLPRDQETEIVERKGLGHPDTICDNAAESVSVALCRFYIEKFGSIMHHNIDKALLVGGSANPEYGGGGMKKPIQLIIAGRAIMTNGEKDLDIKGIAVDSIRDYIRNNFRFLDPCDHIDIDIKTRPGSKDLVELFNRFGKGEVPLSNDTSYGVGYYPFDALEEIVYKTEKYLNSHGTKEFYPFIGEDIKIMGIRHLNDIRITVALAMIDRFIIDKDDYAEKKELIKKLIRSQSWFKENYRLDINTADSYEGESFYMTVTGTSAEQGDDGQVGRGNRVNGLITPSRPMTLEAVAGKNPVSHVGKLYNLFARELSRELVNRKLASEAYVNIVSQIGEPVTSPQMLDIELRDKSVKDSVVIELAEEMLNDIPGLWKKIISKHFEVA